MTHARLDGWTTYRNIYFSLSPRTSHMQILLQQPTLHTIYNPWSPFFLPFFSTFILSLSIIHTISLCLSLTLFLFYLFQSFFYFFFLSFSLLDDMINQLEREERELINRLRKTQRLQEKVIGAHWVIDGEGGDCWYAMNILVRWVYDW